MGGTPELWIAHGTVDVTQIQVTAGPNVSSAYTVAAGSFLRNSGSTGGLVVYGHDSVSNSDFTAALNSTPGGLGSELSIQGIASGIAVIDVELGAFLAGGPPGTTDLLAVSSSGSASPPTVTVFPAQGGVLRDFGNSVGNADASLAAATTLRVYGDVNGDGLEEVCALADSGTTTFTCSTLSGSGSAIVVSQALSVTLSPYRTPVAAQLADVDGDGKLDLVAAFAGSGGNGAGVIVVDDVAGSAKVEVVTTTPALGVLAVNVNADPQLEVVAVSDAIRIYAANAGSWSELGAVTVSPLTGTITAADLDGDGVSELVVGQTTASAFVLWPATNTGQAQ